MLKSIEIKNFVLIDSIHLNFKPGLNIIIGETGAGKSIIVDALLQALGERGSADLVRNGESKAIIEAEFELDGKHPVRNYLAANDIDADNGTILTRREITSKGTSRCFVNDSQVQVAALHTIGDLLADFHGQHEHQILLKTESHLNILDDYAGIEKLKNSYIECYNELLKKIEEHKILLKTEKESLEKIGSYQLELKELTRINPIHDEDIELERELVKIENSEVLFTLSSELSDILEESESNVQLNLLNAKKILENLIRFDISFEQYITETQTAIISITEILNFIKDYKESIFFDPARIAELRERIVLLKGLIKKYGTLDLAIERITFLNEQFEIIENYDERIKTGHDEIVSMKTAAGKIASELSQKRKSAAKELEIRIVNELNNLGLENSIFNVAFTQKEADDTLLQSTVKIEKKHYLCNQNGTDEVEFFISTNKGESPKPLINVASGGEISRLMLAIKTVIADSTNIPLLVFDEIDTGISGRIAGKVGQSMKELSRKHQIIAITHLAQIAVQGSNVISVLKNEIGEKTEITAREETDATKINEIAKLISADNVTETSIKNVHELLKMKYQE